MKAIAIKREEDYTTVKFDNGRILRVRVATFWGTECLYIYTNLLDANENGTAYELTINDPVSTSKRTRGEEQSVKHRNFHEKVADIYPWTVLNELGLTAYVKSIVLLYRAQHKEEYAAYRDGLWGWAGARDEVTNLVHFPKTFAVLKREAAEYIAQSVDAVAETIAKAALNDSMFDDAFRTMEAAIECACECAYFDCSEDGIQCNFDPEDYEDEED